MNKNTLVLFISIIVLYLASTGISYAIFSNTLTSSGSGNDSSEIVAGEGFAIDDSLPKTEACPLNGKLYSEPERAIWETRRPMAVMIENSLEARDQSGLSQADIVYEAVAEGGITRFMGIFYCGVAENTEFAPVRSARTYFLDWASEYAENPLYVHVGGANCSKDEGTGQCTTNPKAMALEQINKYGWGGSTGNDLNQFALGFPDCYRNPDRLGRPVATEHQMVCQSENLFAIGEERGWAYENEDGEAWDENYVSWKFKEEAPLDKRGDVDSIDMYFWKGYEDFYVRYDYDKDNNVYLRSNGGVPHNDLNTETQMSPKVVIVQFTTEESAEDIHKHLLYDTISTGDALVFQDGEVIEGSWEKEARRDRTIFYDEDGKEVVLNAGQIWVEIMPEGNEVTY